MRSFILILFYGFVFSMLQKYDWEHPIVKAACFLTLIGMSVVFSRMWGRQRRSNASHWIELAVTVPLLSLALFWYGLIYIYSGEFQAPARMDHGYITRDSARMLVFDHQDPYASITLNKRENLPEKFWGYKYGPVMILSYLPSAWSATSASIKKISATYLVLTLSVILLLLWRHRTKKRPLAFASTCVLALLLFFLPERLWLETFMQGATDILPIFLILLAVDAIDRKHFLLAGTCAGLSFSAKFAPAIFFILLVLVRKNFSPRFLFGLVIGGLPLLAFLAWSGRPMIDNAFLFHLVKRFDATSLYWVVPHSLHFVFPLIEAVAVAGFLAYNFKRPIDTRTLVVHLTVLLLIIETTFTEVHANHLLWFIPLLTLIFAWPRNAEAESDPDSELQPQGRSPHFPDNAAQRLAGA